MNRWKYLLFLLALSCHSCQDKQKGEGIEAPSSARAKRVSIASDIDPEGLDPRKVHLTPTLTPLFFLYEGLLRHGPDGQLIYAAAERYVVSADGRTYTFYLKPSSWSDGRPVTAEDFATTWKSMLAPDFPAPNAQQFSMIKGAKQAKEGTLSLEEVGVYARDPHTLVVELESPIPYFPELVASYFYLPLPAWWVKQKVWDETTIPANGPFQLDKWEHHNVVQFKKNPLYRDADKIELEQIAVVVVEPITSIHLFDKNQLDWVGSPLGTLSSDTLTSAKQKGILHEQEGTATRWVCIQTEKFPFNSIKMRQAFSMAINREELVEQVLDGSHRSALVVIPPLMGLQTQSFLKKENGAFAHQLFQEALAELGITEKELPEIILSYVPTDRSHEEAQVIQQQWKQNLGVEVRLESNERKLFLDNRSKGKYQLCLGSWLADVNDPSNFLEVFYSKDNGMNHTNWENSRFQELVQLSNHEQDPHKRYQLLEQAETLLLEEMPIIPLYHYSMLYLKKETVQNLYITPTQVIEIAR